jgi:hypothetical protein
MDTDANRGPAALVRFVLMEIWGAAPSYRRPPRVMLERRPRV